MGKDSARKKPQTKHTSVPSPPPLNQVLTALLVIFLYVNGRYCSLVSWLMYSTDDLLRQHFS